MKRKHFSDRIRQERLRLGLGQTEFWVAGDVSKSSQIAYESGSRTPNLDYLEGITELGVDPILVVTGLSTREFAAKHFDWNLHSEIVEAIAEFEDERQISISPAKRGELIRHLYEEFYLSGSIEPAVFARVLRLVA